MTFKTLLTRLFPTPPLTLSPDVADVIAQLAIEQGISAALRTEIATLRTHFDWMAAHINELKIERAAFYQRLGVFVPVPEVSREHGALPSTDGYVPPTGPPTGDVLAAARELRERVATGKSEQHGVSLAIFEDVGDEVAEQIGLKRTPTGELAETR